MVLKMKKIFEKDCNKITWTHNKGEKDGPRNWENLCDGFYACGGKTQSPIDIKTENLVNKKELSSLKFNYGYSEIEIINDTHTIQFNISGDNYVNLNGKDYKLLQFHYHIPSEHTINGEHFLLEVHFVHQYSDTDLAVLTIMFEYGEENKFIKQYLDKFPKTMGVYKSEELINLISLLPDNKSYYNYEGSLTTPPCSEVVSWYIFKKTLNISKEQIKMFSKIIDTNHRPIFPLNGREVSYYDE
jgi:carbonic anhydrase